MRMHILIGRAAFAFAVLAGPSRGDLKVEGLRTDYRENPLAVEDPRPRLSWRLRETDRGDAARGQAQTAYRVLVARSEKVLARDEGDLWDSGRVEGGRSLHVAYGGAPLEPGARCVWKVRVWDREGRASRWSEPAAWETGLLSGRDWGALWINDGRPNPSKDEDFYLDDPAPLFRREFAVDRKVARARLHIAGLGYYEARLNGERVGDHALDPGWTRYSEAVLYSTYDVTRQLRRGGNCFGVTLGNGWYNPLPLRMWGRLNIREHIPTGRPRFIARLEIEYEDGGRQAVVSDTGWKVSEGPIRFNSIYLGERYDARREAHGWDRAGFDDSAWRPAAAAAEKVGPLRPQVQPPIRVTETLRAVAVTEPKPGVYIFDMGRNFGGWASLRIDAPAGTEVTLRYGELLNKDGTLNPMTSVCGQIKGMRKLPDGTERSAGGPGAPAVAWQGNVYIAAGGGREAYTPRFTFQAFRYVEVTGLPRRPSRDDVTGLVLHTDVERAGSFACSDDLYNRIQAMCDATFRSNLFGVQSDCPHRERFGYGGDIVATSEAFLMNYGMGTFYAKAVRDWRDSAREDGAFTDTAPFVGIQYCGVAWAMAHPLLLRQLYRHVGDRRLVEEQYPAAKRWLDGVTARWPDGVVSNGLSDHEGLAPAPAPAMVTPLYAESARLVGELAALAGRDGESAAYARLADGIRRTYAARFLDPATGRVGPGTQASQAFALALDAVPADRRAAVLQVLLDDIRGPREGHLSTGILGTSFMLDELSRAGRADVAAGLVSQRTFPGWGFMLENGATTLWEHWKGSDNTYSHNHPMFGSVSQWFFQWLGGIRPAPDADGFDRVVIRPQPVPGLAWVRCRHRSVRGEIVSDWRREGGRLEMSVDIPVGATAEVFVPSAGAEAVREKGRPAARAPGVRFLRQEGGAAVFAAGSGSYRFEADVARPAGP